MLVETSERASERSPKVHSLHMKIKSISKRADMLLSFSIVSMGGGCLLYDHHLHKKRTLIIGRRVKYLSDSVTPHHYLML